MTRQGGALLAAKEDAKHSPDPQPLRYCKVRCGLHPARSNGQIPRLRHPALQPVFQDVARSIGLYRHIVSLVANKLVIQDQTLPGRGWKTFYDQVWSSVDAIACGKASSNTLHELVANALRDVSFALPKGVLFDLRQQEGSQFETHAVEHLESFPDRLLHVLTVQIADGLPDLQWKQVDVLAERARKFVLTDPAGIQASREAIVKCEKGGDYTISVANSHRVALGELVSKERKCTFIKQFNKKTIHDLLPHMIRLSKWSEEWLDQHFEERKDKDASDEEDADAVVNDVRKWRRCRLAKPFSALPVAKLQQAMVIYTFTEVDTLLRSIGRKRTRDGDAAFAPVDKVDFASSIFNLESFKGRKARQVLNDGREVPKWRIASFRTDGLCLTATFVSGHVPVPFNSDMLAEKGYCLKAPNVPIDPSTTHRGLYFVGESRCDVKASTSEFKTTVVDPGFIKPVHVASVSSRSHSPQHDAVHWFVSEDEWMEGSGRNRAKQAEERRRKDTAYGSALEELTRRGRKKSVTSRFADYFAAMFDTLEVRANELLTTARSAMKWAQKRSLMRFIGRLCDKLLDRTSTRPGKNEPPNDSELQNQLRLKLRRIRQERVNVRTVVFFGDGTFGPTMRGHNAIPKKGILRELCHRGLTFLLDEYYTSSMCPCGQDKLKTTSGRLRAHKSDGSTCSLLSQLGDKCDRDALASFNMLSCALCALGGKGRPSHLCRPCRVK